MDSASRGRAVAAADLIQSADERARKTICDITEPPMVRKRFERAGITSRLHHARREDGPRGIMAFLRDLADFSACGVPEHDVRALAGQVDEFLDRLFPVDTAQLHELDIVEQELEGQENALATRRLCRGLTPTELQHEADLDRRHAAVKITRARTLSFEASRQRFAQGRQA